jgi:hypothetical protein
LFAWLLLRLKQPHQNKCLVTLETQFIFGGASTNHIQNTGFAEVAPSCFSSSLFNVLVNSASGI